MAEVRSFFNSTQPLGIDLQSAGRSAMEKESQEEAAKEFLELRMDKPEINVEDQEDVSKSGTALTTEGNRQIS
jgi:hypothetical protein